MHVINRAGFAHPTAISSAIFAASNNNTRYIPNLNGVNQRYTFAETVVGVGEGKITIRGKLSDINATVKLLDGVSSANRLYANLNSETNGLTAGTLTVSVNNVDNKAVYGELSEIVVAGDFTGLELGTLFARYSGSECAKFQPFFISYKDQSQSFEYDFTKAVSDYILPEGFELPRNLVTENQVSSWDGTEDDWLVKPTVLGVDLTDKVVYTRIKTSKGSTGKIKLNGEISDTPWIEGEADKETILVNPGAYLTPQTNSGENKFIGEVEIEVRIIPNALMLRGASANPADDFEPMLQKPSGEWEGVKNYFAPSSVNISWGQEGKVFTKTSSSWGGMGELLAAETIDPGDWRVYATHSGPTTNLGIYTRNEAGTGNTPLNLTTGKQVYDVTVPTGGLWFDDDDALGESVSGIKFHSLIKLSDYLLKRYQIAKIIAAISAYQAKNNSRYITAPDDVDDHVVLGDEVIVNKGCTLFGSFVYSGQSECDYLSGDTTNQNGVYVDVSNHRLRAFTYVDGSPGSSVLSGDVAHLEEGAQGEWRVEVASDGTAVLYIDNSPVDSGLWQLDGRQSFHTINRRDAAYSACPVFDIGYIEHNNPLPIGHGGKSGFWALDDEPGTMAEQKLGLDKKGNIVAKSGANKTTIVPEWDNDALFVDAENFVGMAGNYATSKAYLAESPTICEFHITAAKNSSSGTLAVKYKPVGEAEVSLLNSGATSVDEVFTINDPRGIEYVKLTTGVVWGGEGALTGLCSYKAAGIWRGLPSDFSTTELYERNEQGTLLGEDLSNGVSVIGNSETEVASGLTAGESYLVSIGGIDGGDLRYVESGWINANASQVIVASGSGLTMRDFGAGQTDLDISVQHILPLSVELQRQHDLAIVETATAKQLAKAEKSMNMADFDEVNDEIVIPEWRATGAYKVETWISTENADTSDGIRIMGMAGDNSNFVKLFDELGNNLLRMKVQGADRQAKLSSLSPRPAMSRISWGRDADNEVVFGCNDQEFAADVNPTVTGDYVVDVIGHSNGGTNRVNGRIGVIAMTDYENPKNSRFYVHNPAGYLEDLLHPDGSMNGTYIGMPADFSNIQKWTKKGDDWRGPAINDLRPSLYGDSENLNFTIDGNRVRVERITGAGWGGVSMRVGGETIAQDFYVGVTFNEVIGGDWKINNNEAVYNQSLQSSQIITSRDNGFIVIEDRNPVLGEVLDATFTVKKVIKGA